MGQSYLSTECQPLVGSIVGRHSIRELLTGLVKG